MFGAGRGGADISCACHWATNAAAGQRAGRGREVHHEPGCYGWCGAGLAGRPVTGMERRQVFDLEPVHARVTEHQLVERECGCGHRTKAVAPAGAEAPAQYGPRIAASIVYLHAGQFLSKSRTAMALAELFGIPLSSGTVAALTARAAGRLDGFLEHVREQIAASDVAGFDETGFRVAGKLAWVHCARTGIAHKHIQPAAFTESGGAAEKFHAGGRKAPGTGWHPRMAHIDRLGNRDHQWARPRDSTCVRIDVEHAYLAPVARLSNIG